MLLLHHVKSLFINSTGRVLKNRYSQDPVTDRSLRHSVRDGAAYAVMSGSGETYFLLLLFFLKPQLLKLVFLPPFPRCWPHLHNYSRPG